MSESAGDRKLNVRNLSSEVFDALTALSVTHDRSLEAEARQAIRAWVEPQLSRDARSGRALAVGQRLSGRRQLLCPPDKVIVANQLSHLLAEINRFTSGAPVPVSQIAEAMGLSHASAAQSWFAGEEEPSFADLDRLVRVFGCDRDWLVHDRGAPFPSRYARIPENPDKAVAWLLKPLVEAGTPPRLSLVRSAAQAGSFALVKHHGEWYAQTLRTPYHISDDAGGSGEATLAWLTLGLRALYRACPDPSDGSIKSFIVGEVQFDALLAGRQHPENVLSSRDAEECPWWGTSGTRASSIARTTGLDGPTWFGESSSWLTRNGSCLTRRTQRPCSWPPTRPAQSPPSAFGGLDACAVSDRRNQATSESAYTGHPASGDADSRVGMSRPRRSRRNPASAAPQGVSKLRSPRAILRAFLLGRQLPWAAGELRCSSTDKCSRGCARAIPVREIARCGLMGRDKLGALRAVAEPRGWLDAGAAMPDDEAIGAALGQDRACASPTISSVEPHRAVVKRWLEAGVQGSAIYAALKREHAFSGATRPSCACCANCAANSRRR